jgi:putative peptidoglycan lipid II flippase
MIRKILSVSGFTLLSRATGFARDILMAAIIGAGPLMDAFAIAFRLPNHFRAIFAEGAFSAAFVPGLARTHEQEGIEEARRYQGVILTLLVAAQIVLLALAFLFTEEAVRLLAPGFARNPEQLALAVTLTRITFPYLLLITLVTFWSGALNAARRFAAAAAAPVLLNLAMIAAVACHFLFPTGAHAAAAGVLAAGFLEAGLLLFAVWRAGLLVKPLAPRLIPSVRRFFRAFGPAVIGSAGVQIAMLADTILVTLLPVGAPSALYYADRLYQLPLGVIAIAGGTVLLPEMSRLLARGEEEAAHRAQARTTAFVLALAAPCLVGFLMIPDLAIRAAFERGVFDATATMRAAEVLSAYGLGLIAAILIQTTRPSFQARGDTVTPMVASLIAIAANVGLKLLLMPRYGVAGLALATSIGAWINFLILAALALRGGKAALDAVFWRTFGAIALACGALAIVLALRPWVSAEVGPWTKYPHVAALVALCIIGGAVYFGMLLAGLKALKVPLRRR